MIKKINYRIERIVNTLGINRDVLRSLSYIFFEGVSRGGNYFLLLFFASFLTKELYLTLFLLISFEIIVSMFYTSYYGGILYALDVNCNKTRDAFFRVMYTSSFLLLVIYSLAFLMFKGVFFEYFNKSSILLFLLIFLNGFLANVYNLNSVYCQLKGNHRKAIFFRSAPFFMSLLLIVICVSIFDDKILFFFVGKSLGLFLFYIFYFIKGSTIKNFISFRKEDISYFLKLFQKIKYSFIIVIIGWASGFGFPNFVKIFGSKNQAYELGLLLNLVVVLQFLSYGINQVYSPKLKSINKSKKERMLLSKKYHFMYVKLTMFILLALGLLFILNLLISDYTDVFQKWINIAPLAIVVFFISTFHWISQPFYFIYNKFKELYRVKLYTTIFSWAIIFLLVMLFKFNNFVVLYFILITFSLVVPYINLKRDYKKW